MAALAVGAFLVRRSMPRKIVKYDRYAGKETEVDNQDRKPFTVALIAFAIAAGLMLMFFVPTIVKQARNVPLVDLSPRGLPVPAVCSSFRWAG